MKPVYKPMHEDRTQNIEPDNPESNAVAKGFLFVGIALTLIYFWAQAIH